MNKPTEKRIDLIIKKLKKSNNLTVNQIETKTKIPKPSLYRLLKIAENNNLIKYYFLKNEKANNYKQKIYFTN